VFAAELRAVFVVVSRSRVSGLARFRGRLFAPSGGVGVQRFCLRGLAVLVWRRGGVRTGLIGWDACRADV
jgi:hypothetical protein